jgi:TPR repeat protein
VESIERAVKTIAGVDGDRFDRYQQKIHSPQSHEDAGTIDDLMAAAAFGRAQSKYQLGCLYLKGLGVDQNTEKALEFLISAAEGDDADAISLLLELMESEEIRLSDDIRRRLREKLEELG